MVYKRFLPAIQADFAVIDSQFPQREPLAFRNTEINEYFKRIGNVTAYAMYPMAPDADARFTHSYGVSAEDFTANKAGYLRYHPENASRAFYLDRHRRYDFGLAYSFFLGETYVLLPFYERHKIPFVFVLYPGGCFELNDPTTNAMLAKIFRSKYFRAVIVTQPFTEQYLISNGLCAPSKITHIYGSLSQFTPDQVKPKRFYGVEKNTIDICFVAAKYTEQGKDKGYDLFIAAAKLLARARPDIRFHVVGGLNKVDIDVVELGSRISFYGYRRPDFLAKFYSDMDIFVSPNRPFMITKGNFDGFPLGIDAAYCGTALFIADPLKLNHHFIDDQDLVIIPHDAAEISQRILEYCADPSRLYALSKRGQTLAQSLFATDLQINERLKVFGKFVDLQPIVAN